MLLGMVYWFNLGYIEKIIIKISIVLGWWVSEIFGEILMRGWLSLINCLSIFWKVDLFNNSF